VIDGRTPTRGHHPKITGHPAPQRRSEVEVDRDAGGIAAPSPLLKIVAVAFLSPQDAGNRRY